VTQVLLDRGLGAAGVGVAAVTVKGVRDLPLSTLRATRPILGNPFSGNSVPINAKQFRCAFGNILSQEESDKLFERHAVPAAKRLLSAVAFANLKRNSPMTVDFAKADRAPLLFVAFDQDHIAPAKASRHNAEKYTKTGSPSVVEFKEFVGRPHFPGAPGWEEIADYAIDWAEKQGATQPAP
jgi:pimeloyl-ACP methyl ester carboxylesterase